MVYLGEVHQWQSAGHYARWCDQYRQRSEDCKACEGILASRYLLRAAILSARLTSLASTTTRRSLTPRRRPAVLCLQPAAANVQVETDSRADGEKFMAAVPSIVGLNSAMNVMGIRAFADMGLKCFSGNGVDSTSRTNSWLGWNGGCTIVDCALAPMRSCLQHGSEETSLVRRSCRTVLGRSSRSFACSMRRRTSARPSCQTSWHGHGAVNSAGEPTHR